MPAIVNRMLIGLGIIGSLGTTLVLATNLRHLPQETLPLFAICLTLFAACAALLASTFAIFNVDQTGITEEGKVTSTMPVVLAACGLALTFRWAPERIGLAIAWLMLHLPGAFVGLRTTRSTLQQTLRRQQAIIDRGIAVQWELKQLTNRINLLEQLVRPTGPDPAAQRKLSFTGTTLQKYYEDTRQQLEEFIAEVEDDAQRAMAAQMLTTLQQMHVSDQ